MDSVTFCSPFDEALARSGPPAIFLRDPEGDWRFEASWTRDAWQRAPESLASGWRYVLLRDRGTGFVQLVLATSPELLAEHPRADVRSFERLDEAVAARRDYGPTPVCREPW